MVGSSRDEANGAAYRRGKRRARCRCFAECRRAAQQGQSSGPLWRRRELSRGEEEKDMALKHIVGLDHIVVLVRDLDGAAETWRRLGFTLAPRGTHSAHMGTA